MTALKREEEAENSASSREVEHQLRAASPEWHNPTMHQHKEKCTTHTLATSQRLQNVCDLFLHSLNGQQQQATAMKNTAAVLVILISSSESLPPRR